MSALPLTCRSPAAHLPPLICRSPATHLLPLPAARDRMCYSPRSCEKNRRGRMGSHEGRASGATRARARSNRAVCCRAVFTTVTSRITFCATAARGNTRQIHAMRARATMLRGVAQGVCRGNPRTRWGFATPFIVFSGTGGRAGGQAVGRGGCGRVAYWRQHSRSVSALERH